MIDIHAPPQPSSPREAHRVLPLGALGSYLLLGGIFCVLATMAFLWLAKGIFADQFVAIDDGVRVRTTRRHDLLLVPANRTCS